MACITQLSSGSWRAYVRRAGFPRKSKYFTTREEAEAWAEEAERVRALSQAPKGTTKQRINQEQNQELPELSPERRRYIEAVLSGEITRSMSSKFKAELIKFGFLIELCVSCNTRPWWNEQPLVLHLDHINGNREDNRSENLRMLCPNCHSQTSTYAGRNRKQKFKETKKVIDDGSFKQALTAASNIREALTSLGLRGAGANYERARRLLRCMIQDGTAPDWA
jgi:hypothetical protein